MRTNDYRSSMENDTLETDVTTAADILLSLSVFAKLWRIIFGWFENVLSWKFPQKVILTQF